MSLKTGAVKMMGGSKQVAIVVPLSNRSQLTPRESISMGHLLHFLGRYDRYLVAPRGLKVDFPGFGIKRFDKRFFGSARAHSRLMLSPLFYESFREYRFILIYHLDALVFSDQLEEWCEMGFDFVGAPWIKHPESPNAGNPDFEGKVGNGGFSLRKIESFLKVIYSQQPHNKRNQNFLDFMNTAKWEMSRYKHNEEHFWANRANYYYPEFRIADVDTAIRFAFDSLPRYCFEKNKLSLPFGCHAWERYDRDFWEPYLLKDFPSVFVETGPCGSEKKRMAVVAMKRFLSNALGCIFFAIKKGYPENLYWKVVKSKCGSLKEIAYFTRKFQIKILALLENRLRDRELGVLRRRIKGIKPLRKGPTSFLGEDKLASVREIREHYFGEGKYFDLKSALVAKSTNLNRYPLISIVTPNYNQGEFLEVCIQSVLSQNYPNLEYIFIDGGSTDNSLEIIKKYSHRLSYWVSEKDQGQAHAINKGLKRSTGEIFSWLNGDDFLEPGALFKVAKAFEENPSAIGWVGGCRRVDADGRVRGVIYPNGLTRESLGQNFNGGQFYQPSCFISAKLAKDLGGLNPNLHFALDFDLWIKILGRGNLCIGEGVWSNAIIHDNAKTRKYKKETHTETSGVQSEWGFEKGALVRLDMAINGKDIQYVVPEYIKDNYKQMNLMINEGCPYPRRNNICFVGDFAYEDDVDSVVYFVDNIFEEILRKNPHLEFHVIVRKMGSLNSILKLPNVKIIETENIIGKIGGYKLYVCPMFGKKKTNLGVFIAAYRGVPIVSCENGVEQLLFKDGNECFIADTAMEFAEKCNQCLDDPIAWHNFKYKAKMMISKKYSLEELDVILRGNP